MAIRRVGLACVLVAWSVVAACAAEDNSERDYLEDQKAVIKQEIIAAEKKLAEMKAGKTLKDRQNKISKASKELKELRKKKPSVPDLEWPPKIGSAGRVTVPVRVRRVVGPREAIIALQFTKFVQRTYQFGETPPRSNLSDPKDAILAGIDTSEMIVGEVVNVPEVVEVKRPLKGLVILTPYQPKATEAQKSPKAKKRSAAAARTIPARPAQSNDGDARSQWLNGSYSVTLRHVKDKEWAEFDNKTGQAHLRYNETARTEDCIELFCPDRNQELRVLATRMELKKDGKWESVANGHWIAKAVAASTPTVATPTPPTPASPAPATAPAQASGGVLYLADLKETGVEVLEYGGKAQIAKGEIEDGNHKKTISLAGKESPKGIFAHPKSNGKSRVTYDLKGHKYKYFEASVGVDDAQNPVSPLTFEVWGDGKMLWQSRPVTRGSQPQPCTVTLPEISQLELIVQCPGDAGSAWAVWCEPRLVNEAAPAPAVSAPTLAKTTSDTLYLSDLKETSVEVFEYYPGFGFGKGKFLDRGKYNKIILAGKESAHGILAHPKADGISKLAYNLKEHKYKYFEATVGVDDGRRDGPYSPLTFEVLGDGKLLWQSKPVTHWGEPQTCSVGLPGVSQLELRVRCPGSASVAFAVWCEPRLVNEATDPN